MNSIREINRINQRELELGIKGSWHDEYKDSAYIFVGGLAYELTEGDVIVIFSQFGEIADINLPRDKVTGKTKGFGFVMYEDQRSTVLAVDNMNGATVLGRIIRVDHCRGYKQPGTKNEEGEYVPPEAPVYNALPPVEEAESESSHSEPDQDSLDEEDPMAAFIRAEKRKERLALKGKGKEKGKKRKDESKEERRARKEAKRAKKATKATKEIVIGGSRNEREGRSEKEINLRGDRDRDRDRDGGDLNGRIIDRDRVDGGREDRERYGKKDESREQRDQENYERSIKRIDDHDDRDRKAKRSKGD